MKMRFKTLTVAAAALCSPGALAQFANETPTVNRKVRNLGMGNVGMALTGEADSSPFYNPAGLNDLEEGRFQFLTFTVEASKSAVDRAWDLRSELLKPLDAADSDSARFDILDGYIRKYTGEFNHLRWTLDLFNYAQRNFAVGVLLQQGTDLSFRNTAYPSFQIQLTGDAVFYLAGAYDFFEKRLQVGATLRPTVRFALDEGDQEITFSDVTEGPDGDPLIADQVKNLKEPRFGLGVDLGLKSPLKSWFRDVGVIDYLRPEVALVWQEVGSPGFGAAPGHQQSVGVGFAVHPDLWILKNSVALELRDLNQSRAFLSKFHLGAEVKFPWILGVRAGVSQGYLAGGLTADFRFVKLEGAVYAEEIGVATREGGNLRWAATLAFNI